MTFSLLVVALSVAVLTLGAELFVRGASTGPPLGISPLFVGLTIVGFGTSSPELGASLSATLSGNPGISMGNVLGSNIFNIGFILGLTALIRPIAVSFPAVRRDLFVALGICAIPLVGYFLFTSVTRPLGIFSLIGLSAYLVFAYRKDRAAQRNTQVAAKAAVEATLLTPAERPGLQAFLIQLGLGLLGLALLVAASRSFVGAATDIARTLGTPEFIIGLTIVAIGTSLPELVTSIVAACRNSADLAVGNIIGSNIFNILGILGACALVTPQPITPDAAFIGIPVMIGFSAALIPFVRSGSVLSRREGALLLAAFVLYSVVIGIRATLITSGRESRR